MPKPLLRVRGVPLLERNLLALLGAGMQRIVVSVPRALPAVGEYARTRGSALVEAGGGALEVLEETRARGNIGCAAELKETDAPVLVVFADNLTTLDLRGLVRDHLASAAALTLATHREPLRSPYGEVVVQHGRVAAYREKPVRAVLVCSGIAVLGSAALRAVPRNRPAGLSDLARALLGRGETIREHRHTAPWVDVNDAEARERAEALVARDAAFECWAPEPHAEAVLLVIRRGTRVLLRCTAGIGWTLPMAELSPDQRVNATARALAGSMGALPSTLRRCASFDDLETASGRITRYHVHAGGAAAGGAGRRARDTAWLPRDRAAQAVESCPAAARALAVV